MGQKERGLDEQKFRIERIDGESRTGGEHDGCDYFLLDITHDVHAIPALKAYAESARKDGYELLADDIEAKIELHVQSQLESAT